MVEAVTYAKLQTQPVRVMVDLSFWLRFTKLKLDVWKLSTPQIEISAQISLPNNPNLPSEFVVKDESFPGEEKKKVIGGLI